MTSGTSEAPSDIVGSCVSIGENLGEAVAPSSSLAMAIGMFERPAAPAVRTAAPEPCFSLGATSCLCPFEALMGVGATAEACLVMPAAGRFGALLTCQRHGKEVDTTGIQAECAAVCEVFGPCSHSDALAL